MPMTHPILHIPKDIQRRKPLRLILLLGFATICFLMAANAAVVIGVSLALPGAPVSG